MLALKRVRRQLNKMSFVEFAWESKLLADHHEASLEAKGRWTQKQKSHEHASPRSTHSQRARNTRRGRAARQYLGRFVTETNTISGGHLPVLAFPRKTLCTNYETVLQGTIPEVF